MTRRLSSLNFLGRTGSRSIHFHSTARLLRGGFTGEETAKIAGGNYLRIFRAAVG